MGSIAEFEELRNSTHALVLEEIAKLENSVRSRAVIVNDCADM